MNLLHQAKIDFRRTRGIWISALAAIALMAAVGLFDRWQAYLEIDRNVRKTLVRQVSLIEARLGDQVRITNIILDDLIAATVRDGRCNPQSNRHFAALYPEFRSINLHDAQGVIRCSNRPELVGSGAGAVVKAIRAQPQDGVLVLARPLVGIAGEPVMLFAKAKTDTAGRLQMVAVVSVELKYYDRLLASLRDDDQGIFLAHDSGLLLSRLPDPDRHRLRDASKARSVFTAHRESGQPLTVTRSVVAADQVERYVAIADVLPAHIGPAPAGRLIVGVSERVDKVFPYWWQQNLMFLVVGWLTALAILALAFQGARHQLRIEEESERRKRISADLAAVAAELAQHQDAVDQHAIVSVADRAGKIVSVNDKFCAISGYAREDLMGQNHRILNSGTHPSEFFRDMWQTIAGGKPWHGLICNRARDGHLYWVNSSIVPMLDPAGRVDRYISIRTDVSALVQAQMEIRKSEQNFHSIFNNLQDVFYRTDVEGRVTMASPSSEAMLGYAPQEWIGRPLAELWVEPDRRAEFLQQLQANGGEIVGYVAALRHKNGEVVWVSTNAHFYRDEGGNVAGVEGIVHDITKRKHTEDALLAAKDAAEAASRAKSAFLSNMSHELRTPLNSILGFSQLLQSANLPPDARADVEHIHKAGSHLLKLINEILDVAKVEAGKMDIHLEPVDAVDLIGETLDLVGTLAAQHGVTIDWQAPAAAAAVQADRDRLQQALLNLLTNAIKYNRAKGRVTIRLEAQSGGRLRINVGDTGIGIGKEQLAGLFTPFSRMGPKHVAGTGIGLTISRGLVELMGGSIGVDSTPDVGSTFWIELPAAQTAPKKEAAAVAAAADPDDTPSGTVLYVEDNPDNMRLMQKVLNRLPGVRLLTAADALIGLGLARSHRPDLILLDINLPGIDGFEMLRRLRADAAMRDIAVVAVSANAMSGDVEAGRAAGFDDYLTKPFDVEYLLAMVAQRLAPGTPHGGATSAGRKTPASPPGGSPPAPPAP